MRSKSIRDRKTRMIVFITQTKLIYVNLIESCQIIEIIDKTRSNWGFVKSNTINEN